MRNGGGAHRNNWYALVVYECVFFYACPPPMQCPGEEDTVMVAVAPIASGAREPESNNNALQYACPLLVQQRQSKRDCVVERKSRVAAKRKARPSQKHPGNDQASIQPMVRWPPLCALARVLLQDRSVRLCWAKSRENKELERNELMP